MLARGGQERISSRAELRQARSGRIPFSVASFVNYSSTSSTLMLCASLVNVFVLTKPSFLFERLRGKVSVLFFFSVQTIMSIKDSCVLSGWIDGLTRRSTLICRWYGNGKCVDCRPR